MRRLVVVAAVVGVILGALPPSAAHAAGQPFCQHAGTVRPKPGLSTTTQDFKFKFTGDVGPCDMSDGSVRYGTEFGSGTASGDCGERTATATWTIRWKTGGQTVMSASFVAAGNAVVTTATITKGEFKGHAFRDAHVVSGFSPVDCTTPQGVTKATYQGAFTIT